MNADRLLLAGLNTEYGYHNRLFMLACGTTRDLLNSMLRPEVVEFCAAMKEKETADNGPGIALTEDQREQATLHLPGDVIVGAHPIESAEEWSPPCPPVAEVHPVAITPRPPCRNRWSSQGSSSLLSLTSTTATSMA